MTRRRRNRDFSLARCYLCDPPHNVATEALIDHFRVVHGLDAVPERWPDGSLVVVDDTLEPGDFDEAA